MRKFKKKRGFVKGKTEPFDHALIMATEDNKGVIIAVYTEDNCIRLKNDESILRFVRDILNIREESNTYRAAARPVL